MAAMDLLDVIRTRLGEAGITDVYNGMANGILHRESVSLEFGVAARKITYYDGTTASPLRVTVLVRRVSEYDAMVDAQEAESVLRNANLSSMNGSYELEEVDTTDPQPIPWDESGRHVWAFDVYITTRRDFF